MPKIPVPCDKYTVLYLGNFEQFFIWSLGQPQLRNWDDIMSQFFQKMGGQGIYVLIKQKIHEGIAFK